MRSRSDKSGFKIKPRMWTMAACYGSFEFVFGNLLYFLAVQRGGLTVASPSLQSQAVWAVIVGGLFLRERIGRMMMGGIALFAVGMAGLFGFKTMGEPLSGGWQWAFVFGLLGGLSWTVATAIQSSQLRSGVPASFVPAVGTTTGVVVLNLLIATYFGMDVWTSADGASLMKMLAAGCFFGLSMVCFAQAVRTIEISKIVPIMSLTIVFNTVIGGLVFGEFVSPGTIVSVIVLFAGIMLIQEPKLPRRRNV